MTLALADANSFYCSCFQIFEPRLAGKALVVASNNDGNVVSRTPEAKAMGVPMSAPLFDWRKQIESGELIVRSSNYALFHDMSCRMQEILVDMSPAVEIYSVDECFLNFTGVRDPMMLGREIRDRILRDLGLPICVGIGPTKVLSKRANKLAKAGAGVVDLTPLDARDHALRSTAVEDIWGIASRLGARLREIGITTAAELRDAHAPLIRSRFGVVVERLQRELQGIRCLPLETAEPDRKQMYCTRSFGHAVKTIHPVQEAIANFLVHVAERMRARSLRAQALHVFFHTSPFRNGPHHYASLVLPLPVPTDDTGVLLTHARSMVSYLWRDGFAFAKAGVGLVDLTRVEVEQVDCFDSQSPRRMALMKVLDASNRKFGRDTIRFAAQGATRRRQWAMKQSMPTPHYTTRWKDIIQANC